MKKDNLFHVTIQTLACRFVDYIKFKTHDDAVIYLKEHGFVYDSPADTRYCSYIPDNWYNSENKWSANIVTYRC